MDREKLIEGFAASYGIENVASTKYSDSRFDASTGTLYCEGIAVTRPSVMKAHEYYTRQKEYLKQAADRDSSSRDAYLNAVVACNAIGMLVNQINSIRS